VWSGCPRAYCHQPHIGLFVLPNLGRGFRGPSSVVNSKCALTTCCASQSALRGGQNFGDQIKQGVGACSDYVGPPTNITGGEPAVPPVLSRCAPSPDRPPPGATAPTPWLPPFLTKEVTAKSGTETAPLRLFKNQSNSSGPAGAKYSERTKVNRASGSPEKPQPPLRGGMPATGALECPVLHPNVRGRLDRRSRQAPTP
jgi:hypothetical protein